MTLANFGDPVCGLLFPALNDFQISWLSCILAFAVPNEHYSRKVSRTLNLKSRNLIKYGVYA